jgi:hypothetical protein
MTLFIGGDQLYTRMEDGRMFDLEQPTQPLLMVGQELPMRPLIARPRQIRPKGRVADVSPKRPRSGDSASGSGRLSRGRRPAAE